MDSQGFAITWTARQTPADLAEALRTLGRRYPITADADDGIGVTFEHDKAVAGATVERRGDRAVIRYGSRGAALRLVGSLLAGLVPDGAQRTERSAIERLGVMLDVSRGAVMTPAHLEVWLDRLALLGFNTFMLYTEDVYRLPDEPYFGYARGAYSADELRGIDQYAQALGIEMTPCIQTLGHLEQVLKWWPYEAITDRGAVMLVDDDRTYELIGKMLDHWSQVCASRRIHVGMDETYDLGRGKFLDRFGHERALDIFTRHLNRVVEMCRLRGLEPMIWSDMYFALSSAEGAFYDPACTVPAEVAAAIPRDLTLVYWDYFKTEPADYQRTIEQHRALGFDPVVASAVKTPYRFWYDRQELLRTAMPCIEACERAGTRELIFTLWGDDGAYCDFDSAQAGLAEVAERLYAPDADRTALPGRFAAVCGGDFDAHVIAAALHQAEGINTPGVLWDDPLLGIYLRSRLLADREVLGRLTAHFTTMADQLEGRQHDRAAGDMGHACLLARTLAARADLARRLDDAWRRHDRAALRDVRAGIAPMCERLEQLADSFRTIWLQRNKPFGLEIMQIRLAGLVARFHELGRRLDAWQAGEIDTIAELDEPAPGRHGYAQYHRLATGMGSL